MTIPSPSYIWKWFPGGSSPLTLPGIDWPVLGHILLLGVRTDMTFQRQLRVASQRHQPALLALGGAAHQALWIYRCPSCFKCSLSGCSSTESKSSLLRAFSLKSFSAFSHCLLLPPPPLFFD